MGDQVYMLKDGEEMAVEPVGVLIGEGWMPGTWVKFSSTAPTLNLNVVATVERSDGTGILSGFLMTGPQHNVPVERLSDMWNIDRLQREGGDFHADWGPLDAGGPMRFDSEGLLQRLGSRIATLIITPTGFHKFYVFETEDLAERTNPGTGAPLTYPVGAPLYVSNRGLLTSEQESVAHLWTGYVVAKLDEDVEGDYIVVAASVI